MTGVEINFSLDQATLAHSHFSWLRTSHYVRVPCLSCSDSGQRPSMLLVRGCSTVQRQRRNCDPDSQLRFAVRGPKTEVIRSSQGKVHKAPSLWRQQLGFFQLIDFQVRLSLLCFWITPVRVVRAAGVVSRHCSHSYGRKVHWAGFVSAERSTDQPVGTGWIRPNPLRPFSLFIFLCRVSLAFRKLVNVPRTFPFVPQTVWWS